MGFVSADIGVAGAEVLVRISLLIFYSEQVGLRADYVGYCIAIGVLWDAISDPLMGLVSDRFPVYGQRRRPYFLLGGLILSIAVVGLFNPIELTTDFSKAAYLAFFYIALNTGMTISSVPHMALVGDIAPTTAEKNNYFGSKMIAANLGLILGSGVPGILALYAISSGRIDPITAQIVGAVIFITSIVAFVSTKGIDQAEPQAVQSQSVNLISEIKGAVSAPSFRKLLAAYFIAMIGMTLNSSLALYYYKYFLQLQETQTRFVIFVFMLVFCIFIPVWVIKNRKVSKRKIVFWNVLSMGIMTTVLYPFLPAGDPWMPMIAAVLGGVFMGALVLLDTAVSDAAEQYQSHCGGDDPPPYGLFYGVWKMAGKLSRATALLLTGEILFLIGIDSSQSQQSIDTNVLGLFFGPGVGIFLIIAAFVVNSHWQENEE